MKLTMYKGCTGGNTIDVDGTDWLGLTESKQKEIAIEVFTKLLNDNGASSMLRELIDYYHTDYENFGVCEQCFDNMVNYILEV